MTGDPAATLATLREQQARKQARPLRGAILPTAGQQLASFVPTRVTFDHASSCERCNPQLRAIMASL